MYRDIRNRIILHAMEKRVIRLEFCFHEFREYNNNFNGYRKSWCNINLNKNINKNKLKGPPPIFSNKNEK